jgi:serine/threonine protein kinase
MVDLRCPRCNRTYRTGEISCPNCGYSFSSHGEILHSGDVLLNRYQIEKLIYTGSMSYVYVAKDRNLFDRTCVIKQVREPIDSEARYQLLQEEAQRMSSLNHPRIAIIFDHFVENNYYFIVVEYIPGKTLNGVYKQRRGVLREDEVVGWAVAMCEVLVYLHSLEVIHRDISPDNIMLTDDGEIKFIDFGTIREVKSVSRGGTAGMGKFGFTPPEQWQGKPVPQSDLFAMGATIYQLLTGYLPLSQSYVLSGTPQKDDYFPQFPPIRERNPNLSAGLEKILARSLQLEVSQRYADAKEMLGELIALQKEEEPYPSPTVVLPSEEDADHNSPLIPEKTIDVEITLTESIVKRKAFSETMQRIEMLVPLAICAIAFCYLILLSPIFGGGWLAVAAIAITALIAVALFMAKYPKEFQKMNLELMAQMDRQRERLEELELQKRQNTLSNGFNTIKSGEGARTLTDLNNEYHQLLTALAQKKVSDPLSVSTVPVLVEDLYRKGLEVLSNALDFMNIIRTPGRQRLLNFIEAIQGEIKALNNMPGQEERVRLKEEVLASYKDKLDAVDRLQVEIEKLFYEARRCEAQLHTTRIELATVRAGGIKKSVDAVVEALQQRITQVREVLDELSKMGY